MDELAARAFVAAQAMVGVQFRPQGYDPATGVDCVGLVWAAYAVAGRELVRPVGYPLRGWSRERVEAALAAAGFAPAAGAGSVGDVLLIALPAGQYHLGLLGNATFVHAHVGLRHVVETPVDTAIRNAARWRLS
ncbi:MAG: NlpC/P60 family protein [Sphingopyxis sp.]|nr:NlpC/P60 family protein [Sphingopyxis sp.]